MRILVILLLMLAPQMALAQGYAAAPWPQSAENRTLPRPAWVMVIPARRHADGSLTIWDRADEWTRAWRVPRVVDGMRVVTLLGDTEDSRSITPDAIDGMLVDEMRVVLGKYGAPALALAVNDGSTVAVAAYVPGWQAGWSADLAGPSETETRENALDLIGSLFSGGGSPLPQQPQDEPASAGLEIVGYQQNAVTGGYDYWVTIPGSEAAIQQTIGMIAAIPGGRIVNAERGTGVVTVMIERYAGAAPLENDLRAYGLMQ